MKNVYECWEQKLNQTILDAINNPEQEQEITEEIIEFIMGIAESEYDRGYCDGFNFKGSRHAKG